MTPTCNTCAHWREIINRSLRQVAGSVGECRGGPPVADFKFPKTMGERDTCAAHTRLHTTSTPQPGTPPATKTEQAGFTQTQLFDAGPRDATPATPTVAAVPSTAQAARPAKKTTRR